MKKIIIAIVIIAIILIGGYFAYQGINNINVPAEQNNQPVQQSDDNQNPVIDIQVTPIAKTYEVIYTDSGFAPVTLTIKKGDTVVFKNQSSGDMWVGSAMHPTHMGYSGSSLQQHCPDTLNNSFDQCKSEGPQTSWSFTFTKTGNFGYHNHMKAPQFGKIIVE